MNPKSKKLWQITFLLMLDLIILILLSSVSANAETLGSSGERVAVLQHELQKRNFYHGKESGVFDFETRRAVDDFRSAAGLSESGEASREALSALGLDARISECFSAQTELIAKCITLSGCRTYPEMLSEAEAILEKTNHSLTLGKYISMNFPDFLSENIKPSSEAYSAAVHAIRKSAQI